MSRAGAMWSTPAVFAWVGPEATDDVRDRVRDAVSSASGLDPLLGALTAAGLAETPPFCCIGAETGGFRVVVRGGLSVVVVTADGTEAVVDAAGSVTWRETLVEAAESVRVDAGGASITWLPAATSDETLPPPPDPTDATGDFDFSNLLDHTKYRDVESAAVRDGEGDVLGGDGRCGDAAPVAPPPPPPFVESPPIGEEVPPAGSGSSAEGDADTTAAVGDMRPTQWQAGTDTGAERATVQAIHCPQGHPNPPVGERCRSCGTEIGDRRVTTIPRPVLGRLRFANGTVVELDRPQLVGRRPMAETAGGKIPGLVSVPSPEGDISRVHMAIHLEGWEVLIEDVGSTNGTEIVLPGKDPERLRQHDPRVVVPGTEIVLAGAVHCTLEIAGP